MKLTFLGRLLSPCASQSFGEPTPGPSQEGNGPRFCRTADQVQATIPLLGGARGGFFQTAWLALITVAVLTGCQTAPPPAPFNFVEAGWTVRHGQAVWRPAGRGQDIAGELVVASHADGRSFVQFTKTPLPIVVGQTSPGRWRAQFPGNEIIEGYGSPPSRLIWLHLAKFLNGAEPPSRWKAERRDNQTWKLENPATGEVLEGYAAP